MNWCMISSINSSWYVSPKVLKTWETRDAVPQVIIPNYIQAASNCIETWMKNFFPAGNAAVLIWGGS